MSSRLSRHAAFAAVCAAILLGFRPPLRAVVELALRDERYSHILAIPVVSAVILIAGRRRILREVEYEIGRGAALLAAGLAAHAANAGLWLDVLGLVVALAGGFLGCFGVRSLAAARFPVAFLLLMAPPPAGVMEQMQRVLQQGSAEVSHALFRLIGEPVFRQGNTFTLTGVTIEIATECSGIRSSIALCITSLLAGYVFLRSAWRRSLLVLAAIPVVVVKNAVRIVALTWLTLHVNPATLHSSLHHRYGGVVFSGLALAMMLPAVVLLYRSERV